MSHLNNYREGLLNYNTLPTLDLHHETGDYARVAIIQFIKDNIKCRNKYICIIHGRTNGVIRQVTNEILRKQKNVVNFGCHFYNDGCSIVELNVE